ncbi:hypothetical protein [Methylobacterium nonmethylotrophicum]|uniref:Lysozyme inhibitor LprI N-terminal domain-containing protein n=1 Tax=Methylobacterium nonmethylotrophicum TaxID=1141884 RepID=A0A4Z0NHA3_9HYPH|nr:hypothetical protein [Methylobacterium nonmethylotrophicum]TGD95050.1 hypothetical protein EU555_29850 [Methylobacterium nonmethylotrophicum]
MRRPVLAAAMLPAAIVLAAPGANAVDGTCARDLLVAQSSQKMAIERLETLGDSEADRCRGWRQHVDTMRRAATVYGRCLSGTERSERLAQVQGSEKEFSDLLRTRCKGR